MTKQEIIREFIDRIYCANKTIESIQNGEQDIYYKTKKEKERAMNIQIGYIMGIKVAKDYLENYMGKESK